jgi:hypothetical protein
MACAGSDRPVVELWYSVTCASRNSRTLRYPKSDTPHSKKSCICIGLSKILRRVQPLKQRKRMFQIPRKPLPRRDCASRRGGVGSKLSAWVEQVLKKQFQGPKSSPQGGLFLFARDRQKHTENSSFPEVTLCPRIQLRNLGKLQASQETLKRVPVRLLSRQMFVAFQSFGFWQDKPEPDSVLT